MSAVIAFILVVTTWTNQGPRIVMQEFSNEAACKAEADRIDQTLLRHQDMTTTTRCTPKA